MYREEDATHGRIEGGREDAHGGQDGPVASAGRGGTRDDREGSTSGGVGDALVTRVARPRDGDRRSVRALSGSAERMLADIVASRVVAADQEVPVGEAREGAARRASSGSAANANRVHPDDLGVVATDLAASADVGRAGPRALLADPATDVDRRHCQDN